MNISQLSVGQRIQLADNRIATIRFAGATHFQTGDWIGVELDEPSGKNDGSVKGERYFDCEANHGMFLRPSGVKQVIEDVKPKTAARATNGVAGGSSRPSSVHTGVNGLRREAVEGPGRRASGIGGSPTPGARLGTGLRSPTKSPTKQLGSNGATSSTSTSRTNTPSAKGRPSIAGPAAGSPRQSLAPPSTTARRTSTLPGAATAAPARSTPRPPQGPRMSSTNEETADNDSERPSLRSPRTESSLPSQQEDQEEVEDEPAKPSFAPPPIPPDPPQQTTRSRRPSSPTAASIHSQRTMRSTAASHRQIEELEAKVRLLERKRMEDRELKKHMEQAQQERDQYKGIIEKLQNKYRPQQQELGELKQALSEAEKRFTDVEAIQAEHDSIMELATLDREMAEEKAEGMQAELEALRAKNEEMELELEILKDENSDLGKEMSPEERTSAGWAQMEKSNERLRDALLRLRDITEDKEEELKERISDLEEQVQSVDSLQNTFNDTKERLLRSEADTNDLRQQLEVALESDEMIEELTERNGRLDNQVSALRTTVEELEDLRDINDELQVNYSEQEKQLQEEIDFKDSLLLDRERTSKQQQSALDEADYTVTRYRDLVSQMQSHLADMQASKQLSEAEAADLNSKSRAMIDLNMKLQSSAAKTQVKTIDLELRKLEAQEASEHLAIVQLFLPDAFTSERDSVLALLRFKRLAFKAALVKGFVQERVACFGARGDEEDVFAALDVCDKLTWIASMSERFINSICSCSVEEFARYESALYELEPVERALNGYIDGLRREEVDESVMAEELQRSIAVMEHLAGIHIKEDLASHADMLAMRTSCLQSWMESCATALGVIRTMVQDHIRRPRAEREDGDEDEGTDEDEDAATSDLMFILNRAEALISSARNAKVMAGKTHRALGDLQARSLTLEIPHTSAFDEAESVAVLVATYTRQAGSALQHLFGEEGRNDPFTSEEVSSILARAATTVFELREAEAGPFSTLASRLRELQDQLSDLAAVPTDLDNTIEFERAPAPWVARSNDLRRKKDNTIDTEAELARSRDRAREFEGAVQAKETELEEQSLRIEMLEARMREAGKRSIKIAELEKLVEEAREKERMARKEVERVRREGALQMESVRGEMERLVGDDGGRGGKSKDVAIDSDAMGAGASMVMRRQEVKIEGLEGAVRYLHDENHRLRLPGPDSPLSLRGKLDWLHEPLTKPPTKVEKKRLALRKEGRDVLSRMLALASEPQVVDLSKLKENKLAWRPKKEVPRWRVAVRKEEWAALKGWGGDVAKKDMGNVHRVPRREVVA
ncbi:hypothetical protein LTR78_004992 [Recurvomyces mirabilis]|uniref:CAP-Gly domain-containing protein n=1 Tax=Recurvomyces mirabilis TaxID=574656 RepID=A0AAE1C1U5_9PEZI|nr:hypothetical protein LTR78_004992 [Recurvomyces mirabilis]